MTQNTHLGLPRRIIFQLNISELTQNQKALAATKLLRGKTGGKTGNNEQWIYINLVLHRRIISQLTSMRLLKDVKAFNPTKLLKEKLRNND